MSIKPITIRVLSPNKNNDVKLKDKKGDVDLHLALTIEENGNKILTIGSRIDNEWVPMKLRTPNKWWDRLYFIPKRFQSEKIKDNKKSVVYSRNKAGEKKSSVWWDRLSRVPERKAQKQEEKKVETTRAPRYLLSNGGSEDAWWNRLSKQSWIQAEAQRAKFLALRGATMQQDAQIPSHNFVTKTKENSQHIVLSDDIKDNNILKNDDNKINEQSCIKKEDIDYEISTKESVLSTIISKKLSEDSQPTIDQFKNELLPINREKSSDDLKNPNGFNKNETRSSNDNNENTEILDKTEVTELNKNKLSTGKKLSVSLDSIDENLRNENISNKLQNINEEDIISISSESLTNDSISTTELIYNKSSPNKKISVISKLNEAKLESSFNTNSSNTNQNELSEYDASILSLGREILSSHELDPAKDLIETVLQLSDVSSETSDIDPNVEDGYTTALEETEVILSDSQELTDNEEKEEEDNEEEEEKSNP